MTDLFFANPMLAAIALVGLLFFLADATTRETHHLRVAPLSRRRGAGEDRRARLPEPDDRR